jgi:hypothetical protein
VVNVEPGPEGPPTIGRPVGNHRVFIIGPNLELQPIGVPGELSIAGVGLSPGYLNNPELTVDKFSSVPSVSSVAKKIYKTGDLARWLSNGNIEFLGRIDHQVKIRGFRIELGEIENQLLKHKDIKEAVVLLKEDRPGTQRHLCAYYVSAGELSFSAAELREYLSKSLPGYMVPLYFIPLEKIPLTPNGKVNRELLPRPEAFMLHGEEEYTEPGTDMEIAIAGVWQEILNLEKVGIDDNFFDIGGNSLNVVQVNKKLNGLFEHNLPVVAMFRYTTIRSLAQVLGRQGKEANLDRKKRAEAVGRGKSDRLQRYQKRKPKEKPG